VIASWHGRHSNVCISGKPPIDALCAKNGFLNLPAQNFYNFLKVLPAPECDEGEYRDNVNRNCERA
jgi:hypothetical protein